MRFCFVSTRRGSHFMTELLSAVAAATASAGHDVELAFDSFPPLREDGVYVVIPHEFQSWGDHEGFPDRSQRERTIALCTENPGTEWFDATLQLVPEFSAAVSINRSSAAELRLHGIPCEHVQIGYSPGWDRWGGSMRVERRIDMLYLGAADARRDPLLGVLGKDLWARECELLIPPLEPRTGPRPDFLIGSDKYHRLRSAKTLLNLHRTTSAALEWMRFLEAICNGCVVVSEPCIDNHPLIPGEHFIAADAGGIAVAVDRLLDDPGLLSEMRQGAYDFVRQELPMLPAGVRLGEIGAELPRMPASARGALFRAGPRAAPPPRSSDPPLRQPPVPNGETPAATPGSSGEIVTRRAHQPGGRLLRRLGVRRRSGVRVVATTPRYARATPRVSVLVDWRAGNGIESLVSLAPTLTDESELLMLDHAEDRRARSIHRRFLGEYPSIAARLFHQQADLGRAHSLNALVERARGEYVFMLDLEGGIYPSTLARLVTALDSDRGALFCYPMISVLGRDRPVGLRGSLPWEPERLQRDNWIDGMALIRRERLLELGGYCTDPRTAGCEDYLLWRKCADVGGHGVQVPQVLGWRRELQSSAWSESRESLRARLPQPTGEPQQT